MARFLENFERNSQKINGELRSFQLQKYLILDERFFQSIVCFLVLVKLHKKWRFILVNYEN